MGLSATLRDAALRRTPRPPCSRKGGSFCSQTLAGPPTSRPNELCPSASHPSGCSRRAERHGTWGLPAAYALPNRRKHTAASRARIRNYSTRCPAPALRGLQFLHRIVRDLRVRARCLVEGQLHVYPRQALNCGPDLRAHEADDGPGVGVAVALAKPGEHAPCDRHANARDFAPLGQRDRLANVVQPGHARHVVAAERRKYIRVRPVLVASRDMVVEELPAVRGERAALVGTAIQRKSKTFRHVDHGTIEIPRIGR